MNQSQRILVVDDEVQIARVLRRSLAACGYEVQVAGEGEEALDIFNAWAPDLIITDLSMPNMGGLELCRRIRATSQAPIIVLSVKGEERAKVEALDAGADDYVTKPFGIDALLGAVWGGDYVEQTEYLRVFIGQLRKKIEPDPAKPRYILTEPWVGYRFNAED